MYCRLGLGCLALALAWALSLPDLAHGQKKGKRNVEAATPQEYAQLLQVKEVVGKLASADEATRILSFDIEYQYPAGADKNKNPKNPGNPQGTKNPQQANQAFREMQQYNQHMARLMQEQQEASQIKNPQQRAQRLQQIQSQIQKAQVQHAQHLWQQAAKANPNYNPKNPAAVNPNAKMVTVAKEFELEVQEKVVVRRQSLPFEYDDKGNPKEFTKEQIAELRGKDTSLPGYRAKYDDLQPGQTIKAYLVSPKAPAKKDKTKAEDEGAGNVTKPQVRMIVILTEANGPVLAEKKKKK